MGQTERRPETQTMTDNQLELFATPRPHGTGHYSTTGIADAGWTSSGQFYWDARRWRNGQHLAHLTDQQIAYLTGPR